jgi:metallo-beta-lactamase class B
MRFSIVVICALSMCGLSRGQVSEAAQPNVLKEAQVHIDRAMDLAKPDLLEDAKHLCHIPDQQEMQQLAEAAKRRASGPTEPTWTPAEPTKVFDNLYWIGFKEIGALALTTSDGIIMIDTLTKPREAEQVLVPGLKGFGLDPATIKYAVINHGHFDHFGGAKYLQETYGTRIVMSRVDWDLIEGPLPKGYPPAQQATPKPKRDIEAQDGQTVTLGDTTVTMFATPGHTPGTMAILFPAKDHGKTYYGILGAPPSQDLQSIERFEQNIKQFSKAHRISFEIGTHPQVANGLAKMEQIRRDPSGPNPFLEGAENYPRHLEISIECAKARVLAGVPPQ